MARWGRADFRQFRRLQQNIDRLSQRTNMDAFCRKCCKELAGRLLALVIPATPVGKYPKGSGKTGGTLRRGWGAESATAAKAYANSLAIQKVGMTYVVEITNPVYYASYVEHGHVTRNGGWWEGRHMLDISETKLKQVAPRVLERLLTEYMKEAFDVGN